MTTANPTLDAEVMVSAVISRTQMPAASVAALEPGDVLKTEPEIGNLPLVRLTVGASTIALASIEKVDGRLVATIINHRSDLYGRKDDTWKLTKPNPPTD